MLIRFPSRAQQRTIPTLVQAIPVWLDERTADGRRMRGVASYGEIMRRFVGWAGDLGVDELSAALIADYKRHLMGVVEPATTRHALTVLRTFCAWAVAQGYLRENVALDIVHPRVTPPDPDPLDRATVAALLAALDAPPANKERWTRGRTRRAIAVMLYAGLRLAEAAELRRGDLDFDRRTLVVRGEGGKGGAVRVLPMCDELRDELWSVDLYHPRWAVIDQGDRPGKQGVALGWKSLAHVFERWCGSRGFTIHAHQLRKTFATELYARGESLVTIQRLLGHADPKTTIRYIGSLAFVEVAAVAKLTFRADMANAKK